MLREEKRGTEVLYLWFDSAIRSQHKNGRAHLERILVILHVGKGKEEQKGVIIHVRP